MNSKIIPKPTTFSLRTILPRKENCDLLFEMFRFVGIMPELPCTWLTNMQHKTLDIVTLFHKSSSPASVRVATLLKQASANATAGATQDQASDHSVQTQPAREQFELNITEDAPTTDQVQTILQYVGSGGVSKIIKGAKDEKEALKKFKESKENFLRPVVCSRYYCLGQEREFICLSSLTRLVGCGLE